MLSRLLPEALSMQASVTASTRLSGTSMWYFAIVMRITMNLIRTFEKHCAFEAQYFALQIVPIGCCKNWGVIRTKIRLKGTHKKTSKSSREFWNAAKKYLFCIFLFGVRRMARTQLQQECSVATINIHRRNALLSWTQQLRACTFQARKKSSAYVRSVESPFMATSQPTLHFVTKHDKESFNKVQLFLFVLWRRLTACYSKTSKVPSLGVVRSR